MRSEAVDGIFAAKKKKKRKGQHRFFFFIVLATFGPNFADSVNFIFKRQRAFSVFIYSHLNTKESWEDSRKLCKRQTQLRVCIALKSIKKKFLTIHVTCLFSVTNLSKIQNQARVDELPSPSMEDVTLQWLPNLIPRLFLPANGLSGYIVKFV